VDVWTGKDDKTLRKAAIALTVEPKSSSGSGPKSVSVSLTFEVDDLNQPQTVTAPSSARPLSELLGQVQGLFGSALGGAGSLSGGGTGSGAASTKVDAYAKCIESAGGDAQKLQDCQSLLTK